MEIINILEMLKTTKNKKLFIVRIATGLYKLKNK